MTEILTLQIYTKDGIVKENIFPGKKVLHLGCGNTKLKGTIGVDILPLPGVDIIHNLDFAPWPFETDSVDIFFAHSVLGHLNSLVDFFNEVRRVGKNKSRIIISVPYFRSVDSFSDPTHKHFFTSRTMDYFLDINNSLANYQYTRHKFRKIGFWYGWPQPPENILVKKFKQFIHKNERLYDQFLSLLLPVKILVWELEIKK